MGKLSNLWGELKVCYNEERKQIIKVEINNLERWCIEKGFAGIKEITDFTKTFQTKKVYRYENSRDGGFNVPDGARVGRDMCGACRYNKHSYCGGDKPCMAKV